MVMPRTFVSMVMLVAIGLFSPLLGGAKSSKKPVEFVIVVPSYNNIKWCEANLRSIFAQKYPHWKLIYVDDCSKDGTGAKVDSLVKESGLESRCTVIHNLVRVGGMANLYNVTKNCRPDQVVVTVDGDDRLADDHALSYLAKLYHNPKVWMTYGSYRCDPTGQLGLCRRFPNKIIRQNKFRSYRFRSSHLRTYYAQLFQKIKIEDLMVKGNFFPVAQDVAIMLPILEMASRGHIRYIKKILYSYNTMNPISDTAERLRLLLEMEKEIRSRKPYTPLRKLFDK